MNAPFTPDVKLITSDSYAASRPALSVLVPFYHDDPSALLVSLVDQSGPDIELLFYDDGTGDTALTQTLATIIDRVPTATALLGATHNKGRSAARNALQAAARGNWVLFLDADMRPDREDFLQRYLDAIAANDADIIFGGFTVPERAQSPDRDLHRALSEISDCLPLDARIKAGPQFVASSNLCVRKSVLQAEEFDPNFTGWGWEDSEWAARVATTYRLKHIDNSALHLGLETDATLLKRFASSAANYARFTDAHPALARQLALYGLTQKLSHVPAQAMLQPIYRTLVNTHALPMRIRILGLKLWRASHYAAYFKSRGDTP